MNTKKAERELHTTIERTFVNAPHVIIDRIESVSYKSMLYAYEGKYELVL